jgi:hypothetical protein
MVPLERGGIAVEADHGLIVLAVAGGERAGSAVDEEAGHG